MCSAAISDHEEIVKKLALQYKDLPRWCEITGEFNEISYQKLKEGQLKTKINFNVLFSTEVNGKVCFISNPYIISNSSLTKTTPKNISIQYDGDKWYTTYNPEQTSPDQHNLNQKPHCVISKGKPPLLGGEGENYVMGQSIFINDLNIIPGLSIVDLLAKFSPADYSKQGISFKINDKGFKLEIKRECEYYMADFDLNSEMYSPRSLIRTIGLCTNRAKTVSYEFTGQIMYDGLKAFPSKITRTYSVNGVVDNSSTTEIKSIKFTKSVDDSQFVPKLVNGWTVYDTIENLSYEVGGIVQVLNPD